MADLNRDPGFPQPEGDASGPAPTPAMNLTTIQERLAKAFRQGNMGEVARLNALAKEIQTRLVKQSRTDPRFTRVQMNPEAASEEDRAYADALVRNLGTIRQMVETTNAASDFSEGPSVGEEVAGVAAAGAAGEAASRAASSGAVGRSQAAATGAKKALEQSARIAGDRAVASQFGAATAKGAAQEAADRVGTARTATKRATKKAGKGAQKGVANVRAQQLAAEQANKAAQKTARKAATTAGQEGAEAATKKGLAKGFAATAARTAPRIFAAMPLAMAEVAIAPIMAFYKTTEQTKSFLGRLEKLSELKGGPLGVDDLNTDTLDVLSTSPQLLDAMLKGGVIDSTAYAFANPEGAAEQGMQIGGGGIQRGGDTFLVRGSVPSDTAAMPESILRKRDSGVRRIGDDSPIEPISDDDSTPTARKKAASNAMARRSARMSPPDYSMEAMFGPKPEGDVPDLAEAEGAARPELLKDTKAAKLDTRRKPTKAGLDAEGQAALERIKAHNAARATPTLAPPKKKKMGKGLQNLLEAFANMDIKVDSDAI